jgi:hypothetical protein
MRTYKQKYVSVEFLMKWLTIKRKNHKCSGWKRWWSLDSSLENRICLWLNEQSKRSDSHVSKQMIVEMTSTVFTKLRMFMHLRAQVAQTNESIRENRLTGSERSCLNDRHLGCSSEMSTSTNSCLLFDELWLIVVSSFAATSTSTGDNPVHLNYSRLQCDCREFLDHTL